LYSIFIEGLVIRNHPVYQIFLVSRMSNAP
jgi:hypothetical protein